MPFIIPYIEGYTDVIADGNCGYRSVAQAIFQDQNEWRTVRMDCCRELRANEYIYEQVIPWRDIGEIERKISHFGEGCGPEHWMFLPELGHIIATLYNVVFVSYGSSGSITCLPVTVPDGVGPPVQTIVLGHVNEIHFILLHMLEGTDYPIPSPALYWQRSHHPSASNLITPYTTRMHDYNALANAHYDARRYSRNMP